jgi:hypothetical protein
MLYVFLCLLTIHVYACYVVIYLLSMEKVKTPFCAKIGSHAFIDIQNSMPKFKGEFFILINYQVFIPRVKPYLCHHQSPKRGRLKVHLGP